MKFLPLFFLAITGLSSAFASEVIQELKLSEGETRYIIDRGNGKFLSAYQQDWAAREEEPAHLSNVKLKDMVLKQGQAFCENQGLTFEMKRLPEVETYSFGRFFSPTNTLGAGVEFKCKQF